MKDKAALRRKVDDAGTRPKLLKSEPAQTSQRADQMARDVGSALQAERDLFAKVSHEIRASMNGMIGLAGLLLDAGLSPLQRQYAQTLRDCAESSLGLLNDVLDLSKIDARRLELEAIPFDLAVSVGGVADLFAPRAAEKGLELIVRYAPKTPRYVVGDPARVRQVLTNLVGNAVKFTDRGYVWINVECEGRSEGAARFRLEVRDTGIGIPADRVDGVFEKFVQADPSTARRFGGTGLGLTIAKELVELMGGTIGAQSRDGQGSRFWFRLTLPLDPNPAGMPLPYAELEGVRVLIVDDHELNRRVVQELTSCWGMRSDVVGSCEDALEALRAAHRAGDPYEIAVLDTRASCTEGQELGQAVAAEAALRETKLVVLTRVGERGDARRLERAGFSGYLVKPVRQDELKETLAAVLAARCEGERVGLVTRHTLAESRAAEALPAPPGRRPTVRVLVAEDNPVSRQVALEQLERLGCDVDVAADGVEAVDMVASRAYDLVFMDCEMPEKDGCAATVEIRRREGESKHTPVVALTAHAMAGDRERCLAAGMDDYLTKPVKPETLQAVLTRWAWSNGRGAKLEGLGERTGDAVPEVAPPPLAVFDRALALELTGGRPQVLGKIARALLGDAGARVTELKEALTSGEFSAAGRTAHTLKGAASNIGAHGLRHAAHRVELAARAGNGDQAREWLPRLTAELEKLRAALEEQVLD